MKTNKILKAVKLYSEGNMCPDMFKKTLQNSDKKELIDFIIEMRVKGCFWKVLQVKNNNLNIN